MRSRSRSWILIRPHRGWAYRIDRLKFSAPSSLCPVLAVCVAVGATACGRHVYLGGSLGDAGNTDAGTAILWRALFESGDLPNGRAMATAASTWTRTPRRRPPAPTSRTGAGGAASPRSPPSTPGGVELPLSRSAEPSRRVLRRLVLHSRVLADQLVVEPAPLRLSPQPRARPTRCRSGTSTSIPGRERQPGRAPLRKRPSTKTSSKPNPRRGRDSDLGPLRDPLTQSGRCQRTDHRSGRTTPRSSTSPGVVTAPTEWGQWDAGGGSNDVAPSPATVYLDDATISLSRVGTGFF